MASTFSPTLRLELIGDGDQSGIWGQTTNNNLGGLLEQAITGVVTISMVDANYTLTNFNGVVDEARNQVLVLTGALSAQRNLIAPLVEKIYIIKNTTTGGFGVQIIGSSGAGVVIPNGTTAAVYCDGTSFFPATTGSLGNQTINGNLVITGTLRYGGVTLASAVTGTGNMVLSASPALTGTPTAPTATTGNNTTQVATTAFVQASTTALGLGTMATQNANNVAITGGAINGTTVGATTAASVRGTTGTFTGALSAVSASFSAALPVASGGTGVTTSTGTGANVLSASPAFTGTPTAPTATTGTNTPQLATTAFVQASTTALGLGTMSTQNANSVSITGGTAANLTLTNSFNTPRIISITSASSITPTSATADEYVVTALATGATINAPSGSPTNGQQIILRIKDNGVARALTWDTATNGYRPIGSPLPPTTVAGKVLYVGCIYNSQDSFWDVLGVSQQP